MRCHTEDGYIIEHYSLITLSTLEKERWQREQIRKMFDILPNLLSLFLSLLPLLSAHRALRSPLSSPAANPLSPHLTYFLLLSTLLTVESLLYDLVLSWIPFYAYIRFLTLLYISTIGAQTVYDEYLATCLDLYGGQMEAWMEKMKVEQVFGALSGVLAWVREQVLHIKPHTAATPTAPPGMAAAAGYAQSVFLRLSSVGGGVPPQRQHQQQGPDVYSMLSGFIPSNLGNTRQAPTSSMESSIPTLPGHFAASTPAEKMEYITSQRSRLQAALEHLEKEAETLSKHQQQDDRERDIQRDVDRRIQGENISRSRSAGDFEKVEREEADVGGQGAGKLGGKAWGGWLWGGGGSPAKKDKDE